MTGMEVSYLAAVGAGLLSFLSPCVLPLVIPYLAFLGGVLGAFVALRLLERRKGFQTAYLPVVVGEAPEECPGSGGSS